MNGARYATAMAVLSLCSCVQRTDKAIANDLIVLERPTDQVVCHLRVLSANNDLNFRYGTYGSQGSLASFRLIGDGYEVTIITPTERKYDMSLYDLEKSPDTRARALGAYNAVKSGLSAPLPAVCGT